MSDLHTFITQHCSSKAKLTAAISALVAQIDPADADSCSERIHQLVADVLYEDQLRAANKENFIDGTWPCVRTCRDTYAVNPPNARTLMNRRNSIHKISEAAGIDYKIWPPTWTSQTAKIAEAARALYPSETSYRLNWMCWMTFMSATGAASALKTEQYQAFTRLERPAAKSPTQQVTDETVSLIREKLVDLHGQCMQQLQQVDINHKQLESCRQYLALASIWGHDSTWQPMRRADWPSLLLPSPRINPATDNWISLDPVTVHIRHASKVGKRTLDLDVTAACPLLARFLEVYVPVLQRLGTDAHIYQTVKGAHMSPHNLTQHLSGYYKKIGVVLPQKMRGNNAARHHAVSCERAELGLRKRSSEERQVQAENARKRLHTERAADVHYGV